MRILIDVGHPAHAHFFKHIINGLTASGHEVLLAAREREMLLYLLDRFGFEYTVIGATQNTLLAKAADLLKKDLALLAVVESFKPDLMLATGSGSPYSAQVSKLKGIPHITCTDTEHAQFINWLTLPFSDIVCTPTCYTKPLRTKYHVRYNGYHELAYLHPNRFEPSGTARKMQGINRSEKLVLLKFAHWSASHDIGVAGFAFEDQHEMVKFVRGFQDRAKVIISSEIPLPAVLSELEFKLPYELMHELLSECDLYLGEGATMASEAAILGVPSIFVSSLRLGYLDDLQSRYGLVRSYSSRAEAIAGALELLDTKGIKHAWSRRRNTMLDEKIDVTEFMLSLILDFPRSIQKYATR